MTSTIAVFGASTPLPGSKEYAEAYDVGRLLANSGYAVATGGYSGTMTAVSQGAAEAGGHVVGVTSDQIEKFRPLGPNKHVQQEIRFRSLQERLLYLVTHNDGMIVLPGGIGTLSEFTLAWSFLQTGEIPPRPLILLGEVWSRTLQAFVMPLYVREAHLSLLKFAGSPAEAVRMIETYA